MGKAYFPFTPLMSIVQFSNSFIFLIFNIDRERRILKSDEI